MSMQEQILSHCNLDGILPCWVIIDEFRGLRASARLALCLLVFASTDRAQYLQYDSPHMYRRFLRLTLDYMYINTRDRQEYVIACLCPAQGFTLKFICENDCQSDTHVAWSSRRETCEQTKGDWAHRAAQNFALNMALLSKSFGIKFTFSYFGDYAHFTPALWMSARSCWPERGTREGLQRRARCTVISKSPYVHSVFKQSL